MFHDHSANTVTTNPEMLAELGNGTLAYMRSISTEDIKSAFPETPDLVDGTMYWALFAADGTPLVLANERDEVATTAFYSDLRAILPN